MLDIESRSHIYIYIYMCHAGLEWRVSRSLNFRFRTLNQKYFRSVFKTIFVAEKPKRAMGLRFCRTLEPINLTLARI